MTTLAAPKPALTVLDATALIVGVVVGAGIFKTPALVAAHTGSAPIIMLAWLLGGGISLIGAFCYAELATTYPHPGGDYHYLVRAFGRSLAFLFAWARVAVIQTGSIALQAFLIGDYASDLLPLGPYSPSLYAAMVILVVTLLNLAGLRPGKWTQNLLTATTILGLLFVALVGLGQPPSPGGPASTPPSLDADPAAALALAMVFVLMTYGGWNEAAYLSAELQDVRRNMVRALFGGIGVVTTVYLLANLAYLKGLGPAAMARSEVVAADLMRRTLGEPGAGLISLLITVAVLSSMNATIITGARTTYALGQDFPGLRSLGRWHEPAGTPMMALLAQGAIALTLVLLGSMTPSGFKTMVAYTTPVFWFFFLLVGLSVFVLRWKEAGVVRPFRVPLYPWTPLLFCAICIYMLRSSLLYAGVGAWVGLAVLLAGVPLLLLARFRPPLERGD